MDPKKRFPAVSLLTPQISTQSMDVQSAEKLQLTGGAGVCGLPAQMWFGICLLCAGAGSCPLAGPAESREDSRCQSSRDTGTVWQQSLTTWCWLPAASPSLTPGFGDTHFRWRDGWMDRLMDGTSWSEVPSHLPLGFQSLLNHFATQKRVFHQRGLCLPFESSISSCLLSFSCRGREFDNKNGAGDSTNCLGDSMTGWGRGDGTPRGFKPTDGCPEG